MCRYLIQSGADVDHVAGASWWLDGQYMYVTRDLITHRIALLYAF